MQTAKTIAIIAAALVLAFVGLQVVGFLTALLFKLVTLAVLAAVVIVAVRVMRNGRRERKAQSRF